MKPTSKRATTIPVDPEPTLQSILGSATAVAAAAGGLIHLEAAIDHRHLTVVATGFAVMAVAQLLFAGAIIIRPTIPIMVSGGALHLAILLTWILSRTVGLPFIPGAEFPAPAGVADVVASTFSLAVVAAAMIGMTLYRSAETITLPARTGRAMRAVVLAGAAFLVVAALSETHFHAGHDEPTSPLGHDHQ